MKPRKAHPHTRHHSNLPLHSPPCSPEKIILAAVLTLGPCAANAATVMQSIFQDSGESAINFTFINDDIGATYNSATLDLAAALGPVVNAIVLHNPAFATSAEVYGAMSFDITNTGNVFGGWSANINTTTGLASINPHFPALWSDPMALSGASRQKQTPSSDYFMLLIDNFI